MQAVIIPVTPFAQNCSVVWCPRTLEAAVIDPGGDLEKIRAEVARRGLKVRQILLTHAHIDHAGGTAQLARELQVPVVGPHPGDQFWIDGIAEQGRMFGFPQAETFVPDRWLDQGDVVTVGDVKLDVQHCPGHTPGHVVFHSVPDRLDRLPGRRPRHADPLDPRAAVRAGRRRAFRARARADVDLRRGTALEPVRERPGRGSPGRLSGARQLLGLSVLRRPRSGPLR